MALDLRGRVDAAPGPVGLLVVGDGATTLTDKAPGAFDDRAEAVQHAIDDALGRADVDALASLTLLCVMPSAWTGGWHGRWRPRWSDPHEWCRTVSFAVPLRSRVSRRLVVAVTRPTPVAVIGPTATGKSALALDLAERLGGTS